MVDPTIDCLLFFRLDIHFYPLGMVSDIYSALLRKGVTHNTPLQFNLKEHPSDSQIGFRVESNDHTTSLKDVCEFLLKLAQVTQSNRLMVMPFAVVSGEDSPFDRNDHGGYVAFNNKRLTATVYYFDTKVPVDRGLKSYLHRLLGMDPKPPLRTICYRRKKVTPGFVNGWQKTWAFDPLQGDLATFILGFRNFDEVEGAMDASMLFLDIPDEEGEDMWQILHHLQL